jgi:V-type H+-transporting ATPase subunit e
MEKYNIAIIVFTVFWGAIGVILPFFIPKGPNRRLIQLMLILTSVCCWLFWLCFYLHQLKPLFGPQLTSINARSLRTIWGREF